MLSGNTDRISSGDNIQGESSVGSESDSYSSKLTKSGESRQSDALNHFLKNFFDEKVSLRKKVCYISFELAYNFTILDVKRLDLMFCHKMYIFLTNLLKAHDVI